MAYKLFLDDVRDVQMIYRNLTNNDFVVVRDYESFVKYIEKNGLPDFISFDNDLGVSEKGDLLKDGYEAAKWLVYSSGLNLINLNYKVHSANPVASVQIKSLLDNYINHLKSRLK